ncbi:AIM24 family protein [Fodinicola feengrottensis]|uniref:AIM24 family protein n=1 Tax=Fodinicola feengrottensis TaxID=435914 RepID=A0ABN2GT60_9ACTN|nr:AIM24 family protein [Fodinicola feengrottensis]
MRGDIFGSDYMAQPAQEAGMSVQNPRCIKYALNGELLAKQGAMVAYRGNIQIETKTQGFGNLLKRTLTGEGLALMRCHGQGEMWFADLAYNVFILELDPNDALSINGRNILVFDPSLQYEIKLIKNAGMFGGGLFNSVFTGQGKVAVTCQGPPVVIPVAPNFPVFVDTDAIIGWSANLQTNLHRSESLKSFFTGGSGEAFQLVFNGQGYVIVQPSEAPDLRSSSGTGSGGGGARGILGSLGG